ncbi:hypothetical protein SYNTR_1417 [Candidatus Syntrophocurvum alkaliphilum]|uniref:Uncharacterized protein n=1 Tax=Candidatus Syntrophocurvum alkaliphilum TaxID=2293317 RepID=A0A6I6DIA9_9FIRM|nr:hypothetical protein [Candidatus Syntrophocurvum alkaliphilum]QGU00011.1 hypothetical protein SYNTR_1417 [Candidatus Syntrophocurvum alkaliphilum]
MLKGKLYIIKKGIINYKKDEKDLEAKREILKEIKNIRSNLN